jgi:uncharacterized protein YjiS (DUF1127 family)
MQPGLDGIGVVQLARGEPLRVQNPRGRHLSVVDGSVWITQQGDARDPVLEAGETFRFDRDGLALVTPLGGPAQVVLEGEQPDASRGVLARMREPLVAAAGSFGRALRRRRTVRELQSLSDHMLRDVGLRRDQIECVANELAC